MFIFDLKLIFQTFPQSCGVPLLPGARQDHWSNTAAARNRDFNTNTILKVRWSAVISGEGLKRSGCCRASDRGAEVSVPGDVWNCFSLRKQINHIIHKNEQKILERNATGQIKWGLSTKPCLRKHPEPDCQMDMFSLSYIKCSYVPKCFFLMRKLYFFYAPATRNFNEVNQGLTLGCGIRIGTDMTHYAISGKCTLII